MKRIKFIKAVLSYTKKYMINYDNSTRGLFNKYGSEAFITIKSITDEVSFYSGKINFRYFININYGWLEMCVSNAEKFTVSLMFKSFTRKEAKRISKSIIDAYIASQESKNSWRY